MAKKPIHESAFPTTKEEVKKIPQEPVPPESGPRFRLAYTDAEFLLRDELRPIRLQLELLRPELVLSDHEVEEAIVFFGSARIPPIEEAKKRLAAAEEALRKNPNDDQCQLAVHHAKRVVENSSYRQQATRLAEIAATDENSDFVVFTGGGPGFMEAANQGAHNAKERSVALNMILPNEQVPNPYVTPELTFQFHYFAIRKMHFLMRARALAAFPGGFGTMDELFEVLTLMQTQKIKPIPLLLFNERFWRTVVNFDAFVEEGTIRPQDLELITYVETAEEAWGIIADFYDL